MAQLNPVVGDISGNVERIRQARALAAGCDIMVCGELALAGYPPEDLGLEACFPGSHRSRHRPACRVYRATAGPAVLVGAPWRAHGRLHNAADTAGGRPHRGARGSSTTYPTTASSTKSACFRRPVARDRTLPGRAARRHDLRRHVDAGGCAAISPIRVPSCSWCSTARRSKWRRRTFVMISPVRAHTRWRADHLRQSCRRTGRTGLRRRIVRLRPG